MVAKLFTEWLRFLTPLILRVFGPKWGFQFCVHGFMGTPRTGEIFSGSIEGVIAHLSPYGERSESSWLQSNAPKGDFWTRKLALRAPCFPFAPES